MAKFFGSHLERKPVDRTVLQWLTQLPDTFYVFVELQGGDFQVDFLVLKQDGIFNVEAKNWHVRRAHLDSDWELADGRQLHSPVLQAREQCDRVAHYLLLQRDRFLPRDLADVFLDKKNDFKIFPVVAVSHPRPPASVPSHPTGSSARGNHRSRSRASPVPSARTISRPCCDSISAVSGRRVSSRTRTLRRSC